MGGSAEALSALCNGQIRGTSLPSRFVCLSERCYGDSWPVLRVEQSLFIVIEHFFILLRGRWLFTSFFFF